jgi:heptosyltransferase-2
MAGRVLVVGPAWVGDMIMSQVIYSHLVRRDPSIVIDVLAPPSTISLLQRMPEVSRGIILKLGHGELGFGYRRRLGRRLANESYDHAIVTANSFKSSLVPFFAGIPRRTGFLGEYRYFLLNDIKLLDKTQLPEMTDRFLALVEGNSMDKVLPRLIIDVENQKKVMKQLQLAPQKPVVAFCPGAEFGDSKQWPARHFATLGRRLVEDGYDIWLVGGPGDISVSARIEADIGEGCTNLVGKTSILDAIDLIGLVDRVVTNDSGLMHVAAAVGTPLVAIYGSTSPAFTPPLTELADVIGLPLNCRPCFKRQCPLGHKNCLNHLLPDHVLARL